MNAKTYLRQYKELEARVRRYRERIEQIELAPPTQTTLEKGTESALLLPQLM